MAFIIPKHPTQVALLIDESGSMNSLRQTTINAANQFIDNIRGGAGLAEFTFAKFDARLRVMIDRAPLADVRHITEQDYAPGGDNEIRDSSLALIRRIQKATSPDTRAIFVLQTDGGEGPSGGWSNGSADRNYWRSLREEIKRIEAQGWLFLMLFAAQGCGADQIAHVQKYMNQARKMGDGPTIAHWKEHLDRIQTQMANPFIAQCLDLKPGRAISYSADSKGSLDAFLAAAQTTANDLYGKREP